MHVYACVCVCACVIVSSVDVSYFASLTYCGCSSHLVSCHRTTVENGTSMYKIGSEAAKDILSKVTTCAVVLCTMEH